MSETFKIRIALCTTELRVGGAERVLVELATRLDRNRFEPFVCSMKPRPDDDTHSFVPKLEQAGIPLFFCDFSSPASLIARLWRLRMIFKKQQPHLCQSFLFHANVLGRIAARLASVPHVLSGIRVAEREKRRHLFLDCWTQHLVEKYVCVSKAVAGFTVEHGRIPREKIVIIPNGIDTTGDPPVKPVDWTQNGCSPDTRKILVVGRLHPQKGIDWLLQTTPLWLENFPNRELLIIGEGPERQHLISKIEQFSFRERIHFLGYRRDVPDLLAASNLLVLPSRWEGMPNILMQAMAAGLPVVATKVEGIDELLLQHEDKEAASAQTCDFGDSERLAGRINAILENAEFTQKLGFENKARIRTHFTMSKMVEAYETLWQQITHPERRDGVNAQAPQAR
ncbi:MAG: glycosyltransferase [Planctomycetaceae bacterium]|nr:glycosyltransferase [Planctomycetaceae bacterium]